MSLIEPFDIVDIKFRNWFTNVTYTPQIISPVFVAYFQGVLSTCGLLGYGLFIIAILKSKQSFFKNKFWVLALHLFVPDCALLIIVLIYEVPCIYYQKQVYGYTFQQMITNVDISIFFTVSSMMVFMSIDRFIKVVIQGKLALKTNSSVYTHSLAAISWIWGLTVYFILNITKCKKLYLEKVYRYYVLCSLEKFEFLLLTTIAWLNFICITMIYTIILIYIRCKRIKVMS